MLKQNSLRFLCEQDGLPEKDFKERVKEILALKRVVQKAFLVRAIYNGEVDKPVVMLCIKPNNNFNKQLIEEISTTFSSMFSRDQFLDILVINNTHETALEKIAKPFFCE